MILIFVFVQAGLRHVFCPATALLDPSLVITASKRAPLDPSLVIIVSNNNNGFEEDVSDPCGRVVNACFWACLSSDLGGVWLFRMHCRWA